MNNHDFKILIVDDSMKNIQVVGSVLRDKNYRSGFAMSGKQALKMLEKTQFDLILLDVNMPELNGFETCKILRNNKDFVDIPVIFLTADVNYESKINGFKNGGQDYVTKPFNSEELLARVRTHLELKHSKDQLKSVNLRLEDKVKERTAQLSDINQELEKSNESLLELDKAKSDFLQIVSHEIMTPLNGVIGFTNILRNSVESEEIMSYVDSLEESANRLHQFSQNAVMVTSLKLGRHKLSLSKVFIKPMLDSLLDSFSEQIKNNNIIIQNEISADIQFVIDGELMQICFKNIIANAIKYSQKNGLVIIKPSGLNSIEIVDEGCGFSDKAMKNLFKLFSSGEKHIDKNEGMGLALANLIIKAHFGEINVKNLEPKGASVKVQLPFERLN